MRAPALNRSLSVAISSEHVGLSPTPHLSRYNFLMFLLPEKPTGPFLCCMILTLVSFVSYPILEGIGIFGKRGWFQFLTRTQFDSNSLHEVLFVNGLIWSTYFVLRTVGRLAQK